MRLHLVKALRILHTTFGHGPLGPRLHILGRFFSCPFLRTLEDLPRGGRLLDIGAGHGVLARLALENGVASVVAVEPDVRKALPSFRDPRVRFVAAFDDAIIGTFDAVTMYDVMYRIPLEARDGISLRAFIRLRTGGTFIVKELDPSHGWKAGWNRLQETISDRFFGLTIGNAFCYETTDAFVARLRRAGFADVEVRRIDRGYPHAHVLFVARKG